MTTALQIAAGSYPTAHQTVYATLRETPYVQGDIQSNVALYTGNAQEGTLARAVVRLQDILNLGGYAAAQPQHAPTSVFQGQPYSRLMLASTPQNRNEARAYWSKALLADARFAKDGKLTQDGEQRLDQIVDQVASGMSSGLCLRTSLKAEFRRITRTGEGANRVETVGPVIDLSEVTHIHFSIRNLINLRFAQKFAAVGMPYKYVQVLDRNPNHMMVRSTVKAMGDKPIAGSAWAAGYAWTYNGSEIVPFVTRDITQFTLPVDHWQSLVLGLSILVGSTDARDQFVPQFARSLDEQANLIWGDKLQVIQHPVPTEPVVIRGGVSSKLLNHELATFAV